MLTRQKLPFEVGKTDNFFDKLNEWVGDVFYDILPDAGFDLRDEQVFMAFQLERAFKEKNVIFAEAGVGTGKTIVYLLYAVCYARYVGKPAIIACADETLIEQLVKEEGDIKKLSQVLDLTMDVRLAKSQENYLCLKKLDDAVAGLPSERIEQVHESLPDFVLSNAGMQSFHHYGDRKEYPELNDEEWKEIGWDYYQDCFTCDKRHRCGQTLSRDHYRKATDLIICSQDFYMEHVWTIDARKREGQMPLLPEASCVVFDEGHLVEYAAQKALTHRIKENSLEELLTRLLQNDVREEFATLVEETIEQNTQFFDTLFNYTTEVSGSHRMEVELSEELMREGRKLHSFLADIGDGLVFESEMYTIEQYDLKIVDEHLDMLEYTLRLLFRGENVITWAENEQGTLALVVMPRAVEEVLREKVFSKKMPYIFSSATMSEKQSFDYMANSLGVKDYLSFSVESPFDYDENMKVYIPTFKTDDAFEQKFTYTMEHIEKLEGKTLVLFRSTEELAMFQAEVAKMDVNVPFLFEGEAEISSLVSSFQNDVNSVLCAVHLWEGLDIPGESLSQVIIWSLPFPPNDPVFQAKRNQVANPHEEVDMPYMILRLRQGIGRLIRTTEDSGSISILLTEDIDKHVKDAVVDVLPVEPQYV
ncbi:ATP-dependent DNA helicase [Priestia taiwanensis]|uniref:ATP-dependent helicase n=1 Tax=Priestia taiwanensis TaxID=1347902 RepID=A0A917EMK2_9BACI|nr:ATP-dependent DNA helicase [Priestia taiwanensis]MBM7361751.1 ATP-dependent DNA helicase DinG [Priestia taiwanensis]GGE56695.1 ATP-dependent helicase [Priestia taiwanensis]